MLILLLVLLVGCQATPVAGGASTPRELVVLTYNIHHGEGEDGRFDLERLARVITGSGADLVALQEVDVGTKRAGGVDQAAELGRLTGMHAAFGAAMPYDGGAYGEAILSRWPIVAWDVWTLPASDGHEPRAALAVVVEPPGWGQPVRLVGTHLDHTRDEGDRLAQTAELLRRLAASDLPTVLAGDLNALPESGPLEQLVAAGFTGADPDLAPTFPSADPERKIDWILLAPGSPGRLTAAEVLVEPIASDHAPLRAVWRQR